MRIKLTPDQVLSIINQIDKPEGCHTQFILELTEKQKRTIWKKCPHCIPEKL